MEYSIESIQKQFDKEEKIKFLFFWGHRPSHDGSVSQSCLSQWWESSFKVDNIEYKTAEHWMMAKKAILFDDEDNFRQIINANSPAEAKKIGRQIKNFNSEVWDDEKFNIVVEGNIYKFSQNQDLKTFLINTNTRVLVEASPVDSVWGIGLAKDNPNIKNPYHWRGLNLLGFALMEVRSKILEQ